MFLYNMALVCIDQVVTKGGTNLSGRWATADSPYKSKEVNHSKQIGGRSSVSNTSKEFVNSTSGRVVVLT